MKKIIIIGASSGLGNRVATDFARLGWRVGIAARREENLKAIKEKFPGRVEYMVMDVTAPDAVDKFNMLIELIDGMDYLLFSAGCGWYNPGLDSGRDEETMAVNVVGFTKIMIAAYKYFKFTANLHKGHIAAITSIAGCKGMGVSAVYSASKRYQWNLLQALDQLAHQQHVNVAITDIRPGFVDTPLLEGLESYPMEMSIDYAAPLIEKAMLRGRRISYIDSRWAVVTALWKLVPPCLWHRLELSLK